MRKHRSTIPQYLLLLASGSLLLGCASSPTSRTDVQTRRDPELTPRMVTRIAVVNQLARSSEAWAEPFSTHMNSYLKRHGVDAMVQTRSPLDVEFHKRAYLEELRTFNPLAVLVVEPGNGVITAEGAHLEHTFMAGLIPFPPREDGFREVVWRASVKLTPVGGEIADQDLKELARVLMLAMVDDGVLPEPGKLNPIPN